MSEQCLHENTKFLGFARWECVKCGEGFDDIEHDRLISESQEREITALNQQIATLQARNKELKRVCEAARDVYYITQRNTDTHNTLREALREAGFLEGA